MAPDRRWAVLALAAMLAACGGSKKEAEAEKAAEARMAQLRARTDSIRKARALDSLATVAYASCSDSVTAVLQKTRRRQAEAREAHGRPGGARGHDGLRRAEGDDARRPSRRRATRPPRGARGPDPGTGGLADRTERGPAAARDGRLGTPGQPGGNRRRPMGRPRRRRSRRAPRPDSSAARRRAK